jgi:hypothetical protein
MTIAGTAAKRPVEYCVPCAERTPHRYERLAINGQLTSRAICLLCNNDSRVRAFTAAAAPLDGARSESRDSV